MEVISAVLGGAVLASALGQLTAGFYVACGLGMVIFFHELGHFAVAKWCGVYVERFSIGFGPVLFSWTWGETEYALSAIPFGGYVKMLGQDDADPSQLTNEELAADPRSYSAKPVWQRMAIISAGVTMNVITAVMFFMVGFGIGHESMPPQIGEVRAGMPAWRAGIRRGDYIERINGRRMRSFENVRLAIALSSPKSPIRIEGLRADGKTGFSLEVMPDKYKSRPQIGIGHAADLILRSKEPTAEGSAASEATSADGKGFQAHDKVVAIDGHPVNSYDEFASRLASASTGTHVVSVLRSAPEQQHLFKPLKWNETPVEVTFTKQSFRTLGIWLDTEKVSAIQADSPAEKAGLQVGDRLAKIDGKSVGTEIDPFRLPNEFAKRHGQEVHVVVSRLSGGNQVSKELTIIPQNVPGWRETPDLEGEPLSIPAIGATFPIIPVVLHVEPDSPAAKAGILPNSEITQITLIPPPGNKKTEGQKQQPPSVFEKEKLNCAHAFWLIQNLPDWQVKLTLRHESKTLPPITLTPEPAKDWTLPTIGLQLLPMTHTEKAQNIREAFDMSIDYTRNNIYTILLTLRSLLSGGLSVEELRSPIGIFVVGMEIAEEGIVHLLFFLGFLSVNLAVLNILPIPVLDGGHLVFLLWEGITRRRPNERVVNGATLVGLTLLLSMMIIVIWFDLMRFKAGVWK